MAPSHLIKFLSPSCVDILYISSRSLPLSIFLSLFTYLLSLSFSSISFLLLFPYPFPHISSPYLFSLFFPFISCLSISSLISFPCFFSPSPFLLTLFSYIFLIPLPLSLVRYSTVPLFSLPLPLPLFIPQSFFGIFTIHQTHSQLT